MSKIVYLQCPTGISGDMCLGALVSLGVPIEYLAQKLNTLGIANEYTIRAELVHRHAQEATKVDVDLVKHHDHDHNHHHGRHLPEIEAMIDKASLPSRAKTWSLEVFRSLAVAEGAVHGVAPSKVHFHEVGAVDAIIDIVGTCLGLDWLGIDNNEQGFPLLYCSALPTGGGTVKAAHGLMAVPVPAVLKLWEARGVPIYSNGIEKELVTPTGAAIVTTLATQFGSPPMMNIKQVGLGAGSLDLPISNVLQIWLGYVSDSNANNTNTADYSPDIETISVIETQIDDLNPQAIGYIYDELFNIGALDVFTQPIGMKKSRPGILLTVIIHPEKIKLVQEVLFRETTTLGIRHRTQQRTILKRQIEAIETEYGTVNIKIAWQGQATNKKIINIQPEFEDCASLARKHNIPWREIQRVALQSWYKKRESKN
ncbi:MAG: nickel pincer cofactor biosynthesis protein LarC [Calothrix sp. C42_A2020_038]|nr:nickel pincer cofactor biosynthesis protein LarC [Calothrix sp. C42_A2020_038]